MTLPILLNTLRLSLITFILSDFNSFKDMSTKDPGETFKSTLVDLMLVTSLISQSIFLWLLLNDFSFLNYVGNHMIWIQIGRFWMARTSYFKIKLGNNIIIYLIPERIEDFL